jgi:hypothetical protein
VEDGERQLPKHTYRKEEAMRGATRPTRAGATREARFSKEPSIPDERETHSQQEVSARATVGLQT